MAVVSGCHRTWRLWGPCAPHRSGGGHAGRDTSGHPPRPRPTGRSAGRHAVPPDSLCRGRGRLPHPPMPGRGGSMGPASRRPMAAPCPPALSVYRSPGPTGSLPRLWRPLPAHGPVPSHGSRSAARRRDPLSWRAAPPHLSARAPGRGRPALGASPTETEGPRRFRTDADMAPDRLYRLYRARFPIACLFRDAKPHRGGHPCQVRSATRRDFHGHVMLAALTWAKIAPRYPQGHPRGHLALARVTAKPRGPPGCATGGNPLWPLGRQGETPCHPGLLPLRADRPR